MQLLVKFSMAPAVYLCDIYRELKVLYLVCFSLVHKTGPQGHFT